MYPYKTIFLQESKHKKNTDTPPSILMRCNMHTADAKRVARTKEVVTYINFVCAKAAGDKYLFVVWNKKGIV